MFERRELGWVSLNAATRSLDFATHGEDVFMVISSAFHAIKPSNVNPM
jgi:hypothetical protein